MTTAKIGTIQFHEYDFNKSPVAFYVFISRKYYTQITHKNIYNVDNNIVETCYPKRRMFSFIINEIGHYVIPSEAQE